MPQHLLPAKPTFGGGGIYHGGGGVSPPNPQIAAYQRTIEQLYEAIARRAEDMIHVDLIANRPTATGSYRFFFATDTDELFFDDGTWHAISGGGGSSSSATAFPLGLIDIRDYPIVGGDITNALNSAIAAARSNDMGVFIPPGSWTISTTIVLGHGASGTGEAMPVLITGATRGAYGAPTLSLITADMNAPMFTLESDFTFDHANGRLLNLDLVNFNSGSNSYVLKGSGTSNFRCQGVVFQSSNIAVQLTGENIFPVFDECICIGGAGSKIGLFITGRNARFLKGGVFGFGTALRVGGNSLYFSGFDIEFCPLAVRTESLTDLIFDGCHFEGAHCLLTNCISDPPINLSGAWVDAPAGGGTGISGAVHFYGCTVFSPNPMHSNLFVIKNTPSFIYNIVVVGGNFEGGNQYRASNSYTPGSTLPPPEGTSAFHVSPAAINYQIPNTFTFSNIFQFQANQPINVGHQKALRLESLSNLWGMERDNLTSVVSGYDAVRLRMSQSEQALTWDGTNFYPASDASRNLGIAPNNEWLNLRIVNTPVGSSDIRLKQDIAPESLGLEFLLQLNPIQYRLIKDPALRRHGVIAQDLVPLLFPDDSIIVHPESENDYYGVRKGDLVTILVKGMQEQQAQIAALEQRLAALEP